MIKAKDIEVKKTILSMTRNRECIESFRRVNREPPDNPISASFLVFL